MEAKSLCTEKVIQIHGGIPLKGATRIQGSKNASLPVLAASILIPDTCLFMNCPKITDVYQMMDIVSALGGKTSFRDSGLEIDARDISGYALPNENVKAMRSGICFLGALLSRKGEVRLALPGGCVIGDRPIDIHIHSLEKMGVVFQRTEDELYAYAPKGLLGTTLRLRLPSVGATENLIMAAVKAQGETIIYGAAKEPEIKTLCDFLNACGARIEGVGQDTLHIQGVATLHGCEYQLPADRIVAGTYATAVAITGGEAFLEEAPIKDMEAFLVLLGKMGVKYECFPDGLYIVGSRTLQTPDYLKTDVYPGFPTDLQSILLPALSTATGDCIVEETLFDNRFGVTEELMKMCGKYVKISDRILLVIGKRQLKGATIKAGDLRGGAALVVAGLAAQETTSVTGVNYIERGYENICRDLNNLGARIVLKEECLG